MTYAKSKSHAVLLDEGKMPGGRAEGGGGGSKAAAVAAPAAKKPAAAAAAAVAVAADGGAAPMEEQSAEPNSILFASNLPSEATAEMLGALFGQLPGYKEVRLIDGRPDIAFVEYETEAQAESAKQTLQGFKVTPQNAMAVSFARK